MLGLCSTDVKQLHLPDLLCRVEWNTAHKAYDCGMMDANYISERLSSLKNEMSDLKVSNARYWNRTVHTALEKSTAAFTTGSLGRDQAGIIGHDEALHVVTVKMAVRFPLRRGAK
jgi:hypothetical protein